MNVGSHEVNEVLRWARRQGWRHGFTSSGHILLTKDGCDPVTISGSPSTRYWRKIVMADIRRASRASGSKNRCVVRS
jgi:hypothetical protein